jgi:hypothetical protein
VAGVQLSAVEREVIGLNAVSSSLKEMANFRLLSLHGSGSDVEVQFNNSECQQLFSIFFADFLENVASAITGGASINCLGLLQKICEDPQLNEDHAIEFLQEPVESLASWLSTEISVPTWLPSIDRQVDIPLQRQEFIQLCGNISKHNIGRLTITAGRLGLILRRAGIDLPMIDTLPVLDDFYTQFHDNVFNYHGGMIAQLLNNVRWGIHDYLEPRFLKAYIPAPPNELMYGYRYPDDVTAAFAQSCFWDLMNDVRAKPYLPRFSVRPFLQPRY